MKIIHICELINNHANGISGIVPKYVERQSKYIAVELYNLNGDEPVPFPGDYDLVIVHGVYSIKTLKFFYKYIHKKYKYVFVPHGGLTQMSQLKSKKKKAIANKFLFRQFYRKAEAIQFLCQNELNNSIEVGNCNKIVCNSGVECLPERKYKAHQREGFRFVYIGRVTIFYKGLDILLHAIARNKTYMEEHNVTVSIIGTNNYNEPLDELYELIEINKLERIVTVDLTGRFGEEKTRELLDADCFLQTSRSEGMPLGVLEALSLGMPVLLTKPVGFTDLIDRYQNGYYCEAEVDAIAEMMIKMVESKDKMDEFSIGSYQASKEYDWEKVTEDTIAKYREICAK